MDTVDLRELLRADADAFPVRIMDSTEIIGAVRKRRRRRVGAGAIGLVVLGAVTAVTLVAIGEPSAGRAELVPAGPAPTPRTTVSEVVGRWTLLTPVVERHSQPFLRFAVNGTWQGSDGCNRVGGRWALTSNGDVRVTEGGGTLVRCTGPTVSIAATDRLRLSDGQLLLLDQAGRTLATYAGSPPVTTSVATTTITYADGGGFLSPPATGPGDPAATWTAIADGLPGDPCGSARRAEATYGLYTEPTYGPAYVSRPVWVLRCIDSPYVPNQAPDLGPTPGRGTPTSSVASGLPVQDMVSVFDPRTGKLLLGFSQPATSR